METAENDLFPDPEYRLVQASNGKRFVNYIIDVLVFYAIAFLTGIIIAFVSPDTIDSISEDDGGFNLIERMAGLILYGLYMFAIEAIFKGKTLGKLITGTRAVNKDGSNVSPAAALLRGLTRAVPFNALSALGNPAYPWHDKWTNTYVIDEKASNRPADR